MTNLNRKIYYGLKGLDTKARTSAKEYKKEKEEQRIATRKREIEDYNKMQLEQKHAEEYLKRAKELRSTELGRKRKQKQVREERYLRHLRGRQEHLTYIPEAHQYDESRLQQARQLEQDRKDSVSKMFAEAKKRQRGKSK